MVDSISHNAEEQEVSILCLLYLRTFKTFLNKDRPLCSHMLATEYFAESIWNSDGFWGLQCSGYLQYLIGWCRNTNSEEEYDDDDDEVTADPVALMGDKTNLK